MRYLKRLFGFAKRKIPTRNLPVVLFIAIFAAAGVSALLISRAATVQVKTEAENGVVEGNARKIAGSHVVFGPPTSGGTTRCSNLPSANRVDVDPGENIQNLVNTGTSGGRTFCLKEGVHALQSVIPRDNDTFVGEVVSSQNVSVMKGSKTLTFPSTRGSSGWLANGSFPEDPGPGNDYTDNTADGWRKAAQTRCLTDDSGNLLYPRCNFVQMLIVSNPDGTNAQVKKHVESLSAMNSAGEWYFDYANDRVYMFDDPTGKKVEMTSAEYAFASVPTGCSNNDCVANNVTIKNLNVTKYSSPTQLPAVNAGAPRNRSFNSGGSQQDFVTQGWRIENVVADYNHGGGIGYNNGRDIVITKSKALRNGQLGMKGSKGIRNQIIDNEIAYNATAGFNVGWEGGGTKFSRQIGTDFGANFGVKLLNNHVHDNMGNGLWTDIENRFVIIEGNRVINNERGGIFHEISFDARIQNNPMIKGNGYGKLGQGCYGAGIQVATSQRVEVSGNYLEDNNNGIVGIENNRDEHDNEGRPDINERYTVRNLNVHDNITNNSASTSRSEVQRLNGICRASGANADNNFDNAGNSFNNNKYYGQQNRWTWGKPDGSYGTVPGWGGTAWNVWRGGSIGQDTGPRSEWQATRP